jgi:DNA-binding HxlR family transcriptional regulator
LEEELRERTSNKILQEELTGSSKEDLEKSQEKEEAGPTAHTELAQDHSQDRPRAGGGEGPGTGVSPGSSPRTPAPVPGLLSFQTWKLLRALADGAGKGGVVELRREAKACTNTMLMRLEELRLLGMVEAARDHRRRKIWRLTDRGRELLATMDRVAELLGLERKAAGEAKA